MTDLIRALMAFAFLSAWLGAATTSYKQSFSQEDSLWKSVGLFYLSVALVPYAIGHDLACDSLERLDPENACEVKKG